MVKYKSNFIISNPNINSLSSKTFQNSLDKHIYILNNNYYNNNKQSFMNSLKDSSSSKYSTNRYNIFQNFHLQNKSINDNIFFDSNNSDYFKPETNNSINTKNKSNINQTSSDNNNKINSTFQIRDYKCDECGKSYSRRMH